MRKLLLMLSAIIVLMLAVVVTSCGGTQGSLSPADETPEGILTAAMTAAEGVTSGAGEFTLAVSFDADLSDIPDEMRSLLNDPITLTGTFSGGADPQAADVILHLSMMGQTMDAALRAASDQAWLQLGGQWYDAPAELVEMLSASSGDKDQSQNQWQILNTLGIDPLTWLKDLRLVGEEKINGVTAYHLAGKPDLAKIVADVSRVLQDPEAMKQLDPTGSAGEMLGEGLPIPDMEDLQEISGQLATMFPELSADLWVAKKDLLPVQVKAAGKMVAPEGEEADGLNAVMFDLNLSLRDFNKSVKVETPAGVKPWSELEKLMEDDPASVFGPLGGMLFGMGLGM